MTQYLYPDGIKPDNLLTARQYVERWIAVAADYGANGGSAPNIFLQQAGDLAAARLKDIETRGPLHEAVYTDEMAKLLGWKPYVK